MAGPIRIAILANGKGARAELQRTASSADRMGASFSKAAKFVGGLFAVQKIAQAGAAFVKVGGQYVDSLNKIQALTDSSQATMDRAAAQLEANAGAYAKMGQTTGDAAAGVVELTKAGLSLKDSLKAVRATMTLAKAGELEVADASTLVSNTLNTFHLRASKAADIANDLANAANISSADVADLAESLKFVAPIAAKSGVNLAQTNAILAELSNSGIKATNAGTGLRKFLLSLQAPAGAAAQVLNDLGVQVFDTEGKMRPLPAVITDLKAALDKLPDSRRSADLRAIFGLTGITSAQVILEGGAKGLAKYTKGVERAGAAQKLANAASKGFLGTLKTLRADAESLAQSLYRKLSPAADKALSPLAKSLSENQDEITDFITTLLHRVAPTIKQVAKTAVDFGKAFGDALRPTSALSRGLKPFLDVVKGTAAALDEIPAPLKSFIVQAGLAALVVPRLAASITGMTAAVSTNTARMAQWRAEMSYSVTRAQNLSAMTTRLGSAARTAAGVGGFAVLASSLGHTRTVADAAVGTLGDLAGGIAVGFSLGGPVGAAIGGVAGLGAGLVGLFKASRSARAAEDQHAAAMAREAAAADGSRPHLANYRDTLDQVTGAATRATRASILQKLQQDGILAQATRLGLSGRTLIQATLGQKDALGRVNRAWREHGTILDGIANDNIRTWVRNQNDAFRAQQDDIRIATAVTRAYSKTLLNQLPHKVSTDIQANGIRPTIADVARVAAKYKLVDRKQIKALIKVSGAKGTVDDVERVRRALQNAGKVKTSLDWQRSLFNSLGAANRKAAADTSGINQKLHKTGTVRGNFGPFQASILGAIARGRATASSGGSGIGSDLKSGVLGGLSGLRSAAVSAVNGAIAAAIAAGRHAADAHSPSRKMIRLGVDMVDGLWVGFRQQKPKLTQETQRLIASVLKVAGGGAHDIRDALTQSLGDAVDRKIKALRKYLDAHTDLTDKAIGKRAAAAAKRYAAQIKQLVRADAEQIRALNDKGKAYKALQDGNYLVYLKKNTRLYEAMSAAGVKSLTDARQKLADLKQQAVDYASSIKSALIGSADITQLLSGEDDVTPTASGLVTSLEGAVSRAQQFAAAIAKLKGEHLNKTTLQQLLDAGVSGGLDTAQALASGGNATIAQINKLTGQLTATGEELGTSMSHTMYDAGIKSAQGIVDGLKSQQAKIEKQMQHIATSLVRSIKDKLGIKSPSRVFREIGAQSVAGLKIGLNDTYAKRSGEVLASSLVKGFGQPQLTAQAAFGANASTGVDRDAVIADLTSAVKELRSEMTVLRQLPAGVQEAAYAGTSEGIQGKASTAQRRGRNSPRGF